MSSTRNTKSPGIFAADALTVIPPVPVTGVSYRDAVNGTANVPDGWPFGTAVNSAEWNQIMYQLSTLAAIQDAHGLLGWSDQVDYLVPAVTFGSDGNFYTALQASGPGSSVQDPTTSPTYWKLFSASGRLLRTSVYRISGGVQQVSVDGGAYTPTGATTFTNVAAAVATHIEVLGGGSGGGGAEANGAGARSAAAGGSAGGVGVSILGAGFSAVPITVGAGGIGGTPTGAGTGGTGGTSSFGAFLSASGAAGGAKGLTTSSFPLMGFAQPGGIATLGNVVNARGGLGGWGLVLSSTLGVSGMGGASIYGNGGGITSVTTGDTATTPGSGGGGAAAAPSSGGFSGGAGAAGLITIKEYS